MNECSPPRIFSLLGDRKLTKKIELIHAYQRFCLLAIHWQIICYLRRINFIHRYDLCWFMGHFPIGNITKHIPFDKIQYLNKVNNSMYEAYRLFRQTGKLKCQPVCVHFIFKTYFMNAWNGNNQHRIAFNYNMPNVLHTSISNYTTL